MDVYRDSTRARMPLGRRARDHAREAIDREIVVGGGGGEECGERERERQRESTLPFDVRIR